MKKLLLLFALITTFFVNAQNPIPTPNPTMDFNVHLDMQNLGIYNSELLNTAFEQLTTVGRDAITTPKRGRVIYNLNTDLYNYYDGTQWVEFGSGVSSSLDGFNDISGSILGGDYVGFIGDEANNTGIKVDLDDWSYGLPLLSFNNVLPLIDFGIYFGDGNGSSTFTSSLSGIASTGNWLLPTIGTGGELLGEQGTNGDGTLDHILSIDNEASGNNSTINLTNSFAETEATIKNTRTGEPKIFAGLGTGTVSGSIIIGNINSSRFIIKGDNISGGNKTLQLPNANRILASSVNGETADVFGNITLSIGGIDNIVEDTTPQLGGDLELQGNNITSNGSFTLDVGGNDISFNDVNLFNVDSDVRLNDYGNGSNTGTATYGLAVNSSGDIIEIPLSGETDSGETDIALNNVFGTTYDDIGSPNSSTIFTTQANPTNGAWAKIYINTISKPTVTGGFEILGNTWVASTNMYLHIRYDGTRVEYFFTLI